MLRFLRAKTVVLVGLAALTTSFDPARRVRAQAPAQDPAAQAAPSKAPAPSNMPAPAASANAAAADDPIVVTTRVDPESPRLGDLIDYRINVAYPQGYAVNLPARLDMAPLRVVQTISGPESSSGQGLKRHFEIQLQSFALRNAKIPALELTYVDPQAQVHTKVVPATPLHVQELTANEAEPERRGEDPLVSPEYPNERAELVIYAILAGIVLGAAAYALYRWRRSRPQPQPVKPPVPPHERAYNRLDRLAASMHQRFEDGAGVLFYLELTEIAKRYLGARFGVECLDRTTDEIERDLAHDARAFGPIDADDLRGFLRNSDLIKFARVATDLEDASSELERVRGWVDRVEQSREPAPPVVAGLQDATTPAPESTQDPGERA